MSRAGGGLAASAALALAAWIAHRALVRDYEAVYLTGYRDGQATRGPLSA